MVRLRVVDEDGRSPAERAEALHEARDGAAARARLAAVLEPLRAISRELEATASLSERDWARLDQAYVALDRYLAHLLHEAAVDPSCGPRCSTCCTDAPPILPIEGLRMARALRGRPDADARFRRAREQARIFVELLRGHAGSEAPLDASAPSYREVQLRFRALGQRCPVLDDAGNCSAYAARPLSCRVHVHVEDPSHCAPSSPRYADAERPPLWGHPREAEVELALVAIGRLLDLPLAPNLQLGLARLCEHLA